MAYDRSNFAILDYAVNYPLRRGGDSAETKTRLAQERAAAKIQDARFYARYYKRFRIQVQGKSAERSGSHDRLMMKIGREQME